MINNKSRAIIISPNVNYRLTIHSDQDWHYQNAKYVNIIKENKVFQSKSRKGNYLDNSVMENFFGLLKQEMFYGERFDHFYQLEQANQNYIIFYNNERIKSIFKGLSTKKFR